MRIPTLLFAALVLALFPSCGREKQTVAGKAPIAEAAAESVTGYAWDGQASGMVLDFEFDDVSKKTTTALLKLGFKLDAGKTRLVRDAAQMIAHNADKVPAEVNMRRTASGKTEVKAKVGITGDRGGSERVLDQIRKELASVKKPEPAEASKK